MIKYLVMSALDVLKDEGIGGLTREFLKFVSLYGNPKDLIRHKLAQFACQGDAVIKDVQGSKMALRMGSGGIHADLFMYGYREPEATKTMHEILRPDMTCLDIGANIGYYALMESRVCKRVYAIEPGPDNFKDLVLNIHLNNRKNISYHHTAIGDKWGTTQFSLNPKTPNWHKIAVKGDPHVVTVPITTMDKFWEEHGRPKIDLLRMDVEGYELNILKSGKEVISTCHPMMFIEIHRDLMKNYGTCAPQLMEFLAEYDYSIYKSFILAKPGPSGRLKDLLNDDRAMELLVTKGLATHIFFGRA